MSSPYGWSVPEVRVGDVTDDATTPFQASDPSIVIDPSYDDDGSMEEAGVGGVVVDRGNLPRDGALPLLSLLAVPWPPRRRHSWICRY